MLQLSSLEDRVFEEISPPEYELSVPVPLEEVNEYFNGTHRSRRHRRKRNPNQLKEKIPVSIPYHEENQNEEKINTSGK